MKKYLLFIGCSFLLSIMVTNANDLKQLISLVTEAQANDWMPVVDPVDSSDYENPYDALVSKDENGWTNNPCSYRRLYYRTNGGIRQTKWVEEESIRCCFETHVAMQVCDKKGDNPHCVHVSGTVFYSPMNGFD